MTRTTRVMPPAPLVSERMIGEEDLPVARVDIELSSVPDELELINSTPGTRTALALIRLHSHPVGTVLLDVSESLSWQRHSAVVWASTCDAVNAHLAADGMPTVHGVESLREPTGRPPECIRRRAELLADAPAITVVVATRERPRSLRDCLEALLRMDYPNYRIVVVDNDPVTPATARLIADHFRPAVGYVRENRRGLAAAHNRGLQEVDTAIVAFVDDDVLVDRHWLTGIAEGFAAAADVGCVSGLILPAELETPAQLLLQRHGGYDKGFVRRIYDLNAHRPDDALFPFAAGRLGSGANMAFDTEILRRLGGFDRALGIGTFARGGDDLLAFFRVVLRHQLVYQPAAIIWHRHHREMSALRNQVSGYGVALGAFIAAALAHEPRMWLGLLRRLPRGLAFAFSPTSSRNRTRYDGLPPDMARREMAGLLYGPVTYIVSRWRTRD